VDDRLKKRLIGATVLVSLVVIFVPMLLQHEPVLDQGIQGSNIPPRPQPNYDTGLLPEDNEDLSRPLKGTVRISPGERLPFMEPLVPPVDVESPKAVPPKSKTSVNAPASRSKKPTVKAKPAAKPKPVAKPRPAKKAPKVSRGWIVQLGSFSRRSNAEKLVRQLRAKGFAASMEPVKVKGKSLYRVVVGPEGDRGKAERLLARLNREVKPLKLQGKLRSYP